MTKQEAADLQDKIMSFCRDLQRQHPDWFFAHCFSECQRVHPEWFKDRETVQDTIDVAQKEMQRQKEQVADRQQKEQLQAFKGVAAAAGADSEVNPKDRAEMVALLNQALQSQIKAAVADIQNEKPGTSFQDAYAKAKMRHPGLFLPNDATDKAEEANPKHDLMPGDNRMGLCQQIMEDHPGTMFGEALQHLKRTRPDKFDVPMELATLRKAASYA